MEKNKNNNNNNNNNHINIRIEGRVSWFISDSYEYVVMGDVKAGKKLRVCYI